MNKILKLTTSAAALVLAAAASASAADLPSRPVPMPAIVPVYNWTGFYIGANLGGAWSNVDLKGNFSGAHWSTNNSNFIIGGQFGYNYQIGQFVLGAEFDFDWADGSKTSNFRATALGPLQATVDSNWIMTLAARFGYAANNWLFYAKAGGAWSETNGSLKTPAGGVVASGSSTNAGWVLGGGIEYAFAQNWTGKIEYNYLGLDNNDFSTKVGPNRVTASPDISVVKVGVNYKF